MRFCNDMGGPTIERSPLQLCLQFLFSVDASFKQFFCDLVFACCIFVAYASCSMFHV